MSQIHDIIIIGGGPVGLFGVYSAGLLQLDAVLIERLDRLGGQLAYLYPEKPIYDVGGFPRVRADELVDRLKQQAFQYPATVVTGAEAVHLRHTDDRWVVDTTRESYEARAVVITSGIGEFRPRKYGIEAIDRWEGRGLFYVVGRLEAFRDQDVLVVGGGDSAADWAMAVAEVARSVTMIHRRDTFQCHPDSLQKLTRHPRIRLVPETELRAVDGERDRVSRVLVYRRDTQKEETWPIDSVIVAIGLIPGTDIFREWGLNMTGNEIPVDTRMATNLPGVFAAGDIVTYPGKVKLIAVGFGEVATAVESVRHFLQASGR